jgi:Lipopolysaccharide kinase (Kdo/WaaP) family
MSRSALGDLLPDGFSRVSGSGGRTWILRNGFPRDIPVERWDSWLAGRESQSLSAAGGRAPVLLVSLGRVGEVAVRRYLHGGLLAGWTRDLFWGGGRPLAELVASEHIRARGIASPEILALYLLQAGGPFRRGCVVTRRVPRSQNLGEWLRLEGCHPGAWSPLLREVARAVARLHDAGCVHGDLNLRNLLHSPSGVWILDLDRARLQPAASLRDRGWNLLRLYRSLGKESSRRVPLTQPQRLHFLRHYAMGNRALFRSLAVWTGRRRMIVRWRGSSARSRFKPFPLQGVNREAARRPPERP